MFKGILGKKREDSSEESAVDAALVEKISKMNLTEMRSYIKNNIKDFEVSEEIIVISENKKINFVTVELIQKFVEIYCDIIEQYDTEHKEIYSSRFVDAVNVALANINKKVVLQNKMDVLGENNSSL